MSCMKIWMCSALQKKRIQISCHYGTQWPEAKGKNLYGKMWEHESTKFEPKKEHAKMNERTVRAKKTENNRTKIRCENLNAITFSIGTREWLCAQALISRFLFISQPMCCRCQCWWCVHSIVLQQALCRRKKKKSNDIGDDQQRELHAKSNGAWKTKRNESKGEERKSQKVFGVLKIWRWTRETAMNVLWCMQIPRIMLCVRVFVSRPFRKEAPRNSIFLWMYKWVLSSWLNQWTKRSFGETLKSLSDQPMHTHSRTLMPRTSSLSTVVRVRCAFFIPF